MTWATASLKSAGVWRGGELRRAVPRFRGPGDPEGVASATTRTVVVSSLAVLALDFLLTAWMFATP